ncbi:MAG: hypothetical protein K0U93_03560, partial [Gammaproteobacteria bacterium]|nr:hypothetical protein [Gammaproteobacteria bacterium]
RGQRAGPLCLGKIDRVCYRLSQSARGPVFSRRFGKLRPRARAQALVVPKVRGRFFRFMVAAM